MKMHDISGRRIRTAGIAAVLSLALVCGMAAPLGTGYPALQSTVYAEDTGSYDPAENYLYEELDDGTIMITGYRAYKTDLKIPAYIDGKPVTRLGDEVFHLYAMDDEYQAFLTSIVVPDTVTWIGDLCFNAQTKLTTIVLPEHLEHIGYCAFNVTAWMDDKLAREDLIYLSNIVIEGSNCYGTVIIEDGTKAIAGEAFLNSDVEQLYIPASVTEIGKSAFSGCDNLRIFCEAGSYAETYAKENGIPCTADGTVPEIVAQEHLGKPFIVEGNAFIDRNPDGTYCMIQSREGYVVGREVTVSTLDPGTGLITNVKCIKTRDNLFSEAFLGENYNFLLFRKGTVAQSCNYEPELQVNALHLYKYSKTWEYLGEAELPLTASTGTDVLSENDGILSISVRIENHQFDPEIGFDDTVHKTAYRVLKIDEETLDYQMTSYETDGTAKRLALDGTSSYLTAYKKAVDQGEYSPAELYVNAYDADGLRPETNQRLTVYAEDAHNDILWLNSFLRKNQANYLFWGQGDRRRLDDGAYNPDASEANSKLMMAQISDEGELIGTPKVLEGISMYGTPSCGMDDRLRFAEVKDDRDGNATVRVCTVLTENAGELTYETFSNRSTSALGDLDADGEINAADAVVVLIAAANIGAGNDSGLTEAQASAADIDANGSIDASDAAILLIYSAAVGAGQTDAKLTDFIQ